MTLDTASEEHRWRCLVRWAIALRVAEGSAHANEWLDSFEKKRKDGGALRAAVKEQWALGGRGKWGEWLEPRPTTVGLF